MSCSGERNRQAGSLQGPARVSTGQVDGAQRCQHPRCTLPINKATGRCPRGHTQDRATALREVLGQAQRFEIWLREEGVKREWELSSAKGWPLPTVDYPLPEVAGTDLTPEEIEQQIAAAAAWFQSIPEGTRARLDKRLPKPWTIPSVFRDAERRSDMSPSQIVMQNIADAQATGSANKTVVPCPLQDSLHGLTSFAYDVEHTTGPQGGQFVVRPRSGWSSEEEALRRAAGVALTATEKGPAWIIPAAQVEREIGRLEAMLAAQGGARGPSDLRIRSEVPPDQRDEAEAFLRNGICQVRALLVDTLGFGETSIQVETGRGNVATGRFVLPPDVLVEMARQFVAGEGWTGLRGEWGVIEVPVPPEDRENAWAFLRNGETKRGTAFELNLAPGRATLYIHNSRGNVSSGYIRAPLGVWRAAFEQVLAGTQGTREEAGLQERLKQAAEEFMSTAAPVPAAPAEAAGKAGKPRTSRVRALCNQAIEMLHKWQDEETEALVDQLAQATQRGSGMGAALAELAVYIDRNNLDAADEPAELARQISIALGWRDEND